MQFVRLSVKILMLYRYMLKIVNGGFVIRRKIKASIEGGANPMAKCDICGKGVTFGIKVSHSHRRTNRAFKPNVQKVKAIVNGTPCRVHACSRCLRSGKVERAN